MIDTMALLISCKLALITSISLIILCTPLALYLTYSTTTLKYIVEVIVTLPLVLPPTVLGFYLLILFSPNTLIGNLYLKLTGNNLTFSFFGLVIGSIIFSLPFVLKPIQTAFEAIPQALLEAAACLGATPLKRFTSIIFPLAKSAYLSSFILGFAHTLGEFGVVLMLGGNIPGKTRTVSMVIYDSVEQLNYSLAHDMAALLLIIALILISCVAVLNATTHHKRNKINKRNKKFYV